MSLAFFVVVDGWFVGIFVLLLMVVDLFRFVGVFLFVCLFVFVVVGGDVFLFCCC